jgi:uncharacterized protein with NRDE domain
MCTVITLFHVRGDYPLVIAANRDEHYDRPSSGPVVLDRPPAVLAGRDLRCGGTWFGITPRGMAVAVTDQANTPDAEPRRSRGLLVLDALACPSPAAVAALLVATPADEYAPFALLYADAREATIDYRTRQDARREELSPGVHVLVSGIGADHAASRLARLRELLDPGQLARLDSDALRATLAGVLGAHASAPGADDAVCRHGDKAGTVSAFVALLGSEVADSRLFCAVGPPCSTAMRDESRLFAGLAPVVGA